jgi:hypothetical protein
MYELVEYHGETKAAQDLLNGMLDIDAIENLDAVPGIKEIDDHISTDNFEQGFKH